MVGPAETWENTGSWKDLLYCWRQSEGTQSIVRFFSVSLNITDKCALGSRVFFPRRAGERHQYVRLSKQESNGTYERVHLGSSIDPSGYVQSAQKKWLHSLSPTSGPKIASSGGIELHSHLYSSLR